MSNFEDVSSDNNDVSSDTKKMSQDIEKLITRVLDLDCEVRAKLQVRSLSSVQGEDSVETNSETRRNILKHKGKNNENVKIKFQKGM